ncbi:glycoside hydrolase family 25 protein [Rhodobacteraceae bacterium M382]|nr:glycoside hydrolase family 25 protein [Rhodobacteraceae bacterium M382]
MRAVLSLVLLLLLALPAAAQVPRGLGDSDPVDFKGKPPSRYPVHGIDVARFQPQVDWTQARKAGIDFAFIKATEGGDFLDPMFKSHWRGAGRARILRGAYHFFYFCRPAADQARWFIRNVPKTRGMLPPVLDMEWNPFSPTCTKRPHGSVVRREAQIFLDMIERHYGQRPILYTTPEFYRQTDIGKLKNTEFWVRSTAKTPDRAYPKQNWHFWQYSSTGIVPGIEGDVDLNAFGGSKRQWKRWVAARQNQ